MEQLERWDKIFLDKKQTIESEVNSYLSCRDGIVECYEYRSDSGYGTKTKLFLCRNTKHEVVSIIRQFKKIDGDWIEQSMEFDSDSFEYMKALIIGKKDEGGGKYTLVRDYNDRFTA